MARIARGKDKSLSKNNSSLQTLLCSKSGIVVSIAMSCFIYFLIMNWTSSYRKAHVEDLLRSDISVFTSQKQHATPKIDKAADEQIEAGNDVIKDPTQRDLERRRRLYEEKCSNRQIGYVSELFLHPPSKLSVCHVPKAGCTFWKRLFRYLNMDHSRSNISNPLDIARTQAHFGPSINLQTFNYHTPEGRLMVDASSKVLMVRNPYRRLWSVYLDKFVLPEWWLDHGKAIMFERSDKKTMRDCPDDITFEEFLQYSLLNHERHWRPISELCDPCNLRPKFVGHVETFERDVRYILTTLGMQSLLEDYTETKRLTTDITDMVDYHYQLYQQRRPLHTCLTRVQLASSLWRVLQLNGYYRMDHEFPELEVDAVLTGATPKQAKDGVVQVFLKNFKSRPVTESAWNAQRDAIVWEAYRNVSDATKQKIIRRYHSDFDLFGFSTSTDVESLASVQAKKENGK